MANELAMGFVLALFCQDVHRYADSHKTLSADDDCSFFGLLLLPKRRKTSLLGVHHGLECSLFCHFGNRFLSFERQTQYEKNAVFWGNGMHEDVFIEFVKCNTNRWACYILSNFVAFYVFVQNDETWLNVRFFVWPWNLLHQEPQCVKCGSFFTTYYGVRQISKLWYITKHCLRTFWELFM